MGIRHKEVFFYTRNPNAIKYQVTVIDNHGMHAKITMACYFAFATLGKIKKSAIITAAEVVAQWKLGNCLWKC